MVVSNAQLIDRHLWRVCEGQTKSYVAPLVDSIEELDVLEQILEAAKPPRSDPSSSLHFLLYTPFRYPERTPTGSRFVRSAAQGAMYAAEVSHVSMIESSHWMYYHFIAPSDGLRKETINLGRTVFEFTVTGAAIDLMAPPYVVRSTEWMHPNDYRPCQELGSAARTNGIHLVRYASVRDDRHRAAVVVMSWQAINCDSPLSVEGWDVFISPGQVVWTAVQGTARLVLNMV